MSLVWSRSSTVLLTTSFCFAFFGAGYAQLAFDDDGCRTPDRGVGNCVSLSECGPMVEVLQGLKGRVSHTILKRLQAYTCGINASGVKVCCPPGPIILDQDKTPILKSGPTNNDSNHRNLYLLPKDCGYLDTGDKVVGGDNARLNEFPWMALLQYKRGGNLSFNCGGTIINKNYILTAGHCITGLSSELVSVRVGEYSIKNTTDCETIRKKTKCNPAVQDLKIEEVIPHPQFGTKSLMNDIGLIRVSTINLELVSTRPVCLPTGNLQPYTNVIVTGWGVINSKTGETSDILQKVTLPVANNESCTKTYEGHNIKLGNAQICAGGVINKDSCPGDSGGPMMVADIDESGIAKYFQAGVVSFGPKYCGIPGYPGVYTLVRYYMNWILDNIKP